MKLLICMLIGGGGLVAGCGMWSTENGARGAFNAFTTPCHVESFIYSIKDNGDGTQTFSVTCRRFAREQK